MSDSTNSTQTKRSIKLIRGKPCTPIKKVGAKERRHCFPKIRVTNNAPSTNLAVPSGLRETMPASPEVPPESPQDLDSKGILSVDPPSPIGIHVEVVSGFSDQEDKSEGLLSRSRSEEGLTRYQAVSTPSIPAPPRSDSSLLRVKAQIRAATAASKENSIRQIEEPYDGERANASDISDLSSAGGGALHDMPTQAGALLQRIKARLEESKNLSRDIRDAVCDGIQVLYQMILRLADSRQRHITEKEKKTSYYEHLIARAEARHATALKDLQIKQLEREGEIATNVLKTFKEAEASRYLIYEIEARLKEHAEWERKIEHELKKLSSINVNKEYEDSYSATTAAMTITKDDTSSVDFRNIKEDIAIIKKELRTRRPPAHAGNEQPSRQGPQEVFNPPSHKTYAEALGAARYSVVVESADPRHCGDDIVNYIKKRVDVVELGVGINGVKKMKNQRVMISCDSEGDRRTLSHAIAQSGDKLTVSQPTIKNPLLKLMGVANDLSDQKLEEAIVKQNLKLLADITSECPMPKVVRRTKARTNELSNVIIEIGPQHWKALVNQRIRIGYQVVKAVDQSPVIQCYKCLGFGHRAGTCRGELICGYCAGSHDTRKCEDRSNKDAKCANCETENNHPAYSQTCPVWQKWDRIARTTVSYC